MKQQICKHCNEAFPELAPLVFANHVRWCNSNEKGTDKFLLYCSCTICRVKTTVQSIKAHFNRYHVEKEPVKEEIKSFCLQCSKPMFREGKFCNQSCSATYHNNRRDYTKIRPGPAKGYKRTNTPLYTKVKQCPICNKWHPKNGSTCSEICRRKLLSVRINARIDAGWNPQNNRNRSRPSYLEKTFEEWILLNNISNYIKGKTFRCNGKIYYGDFFFPDKMLLIELDGGQHKNSIEYDTKRDADILECHQVTTLRISYTEFKKKTKVELVKELLGIKEQMTGLEPAEPIRL